MTWTQNDVAAVDDAIRALVAGERVVTVKYADGTETTYGQANLSELRSIRREMVGEASRVASGPVYRAFRFGPRGGY